MYTTWTNEHNYTCINDYGWKCLFNTLGIYRIAGSSWPDIRPFFNIQFRLRQKCWKLLDICMIWYIRLIIKSWQYAAIHRTQYIQGGPKKLDQFWKDITPVYDDNSKCSIYQIFQFLIESKTGASNAPKLNILCTTRVKLYIHQKQQVI